MNNNRKEIDVARTKEELKIVNDKIDNMHIVAWEKLMSMSKESLIELIILWKHRAERK